MANYDLLSDHQLVALIGESDHSAYEMLYQRYFRLLFGYAYKKLRDKEQAKDIIQELFANLWVKRDTTNFNSNVSGYLFASVNNKIIDHFLHKNVTEKYLASFAGFLKTEQVKTDHRIREKQLAALIENEIQQLPSKMREVFELSRNEHLSHKEIADKLGIAEKTVDRQVSNALYRLRTRLGLLTFLLLLLKF
jgi:RNA polymerase sigma-70 factor (family 1)